MVNNRYKLGTIIGSGGMSEVYEAEDTVLGRQVAVKVLRPEMAHDVNFRERFRREAQNSGKLNHPNIVSVFDTGEYDDNGLALPYIVMELVHGRTLRDILHESGPMPATEAAEILARVADALQASHEAGIIHRDVKPANIMLTNTGQVKVMDFGIARALDDSTSAMTQTSAVIGTAQYLSPEQARGKHADARSDVYALGCVMYEAVTGQTPFAGETPFAVAYQHVQEEPTPPSELIDDPSLTPTQRVNIDAVILTAMAKHPADRYQSAWEMGQDLQKLAAGQVTQAARLHVPEEAEQPTSMLAATAASTSHPAPVASTRPDENEAEADDRRVGWMKWLAVFLAAVLVVIVGYFAWEIWSPRGDGQQQSGGTSENNPAAVIVPEVENRPRSEVVSELEELGLLVTVNEEPNPDIARGNAIRINPASGSELQKNSSVTLTVSSGKETTDVPDVTGMTLEQASAALNEAGLLLNENVSETNDDAPAGEIISQDPAGGSQLSKGSKIRVAVSKGKETFTVPDVTGMDRNQAISTLEEMGFEVNPRMVDSVEPENRVIRMSNQGQKLAEGDTVTIDISNNMLMTAPNLLNMSEADAKRALADAGWRGNWNVGEPIPTGAFVDNERVGWASVNQGALIRKNDPIDVRLWIFDPSALL